MLGNRIYQELSNAVAGSQEYMAMEESTSCTRRAATTCSVLDTPPSRNATSDAPKRLSQLIDSRSLQFFSGAGRRGLGLVGRDWPPVLGAQAGHGHRLPD